MSLADEIKAGYARGWCYIPLRGKTKIPSAKGWQKMHGDNRASLDDCLKWAGNGNVGLLTGSASGIMVVDIDPGADPEIKNKLPVTVAVKTGRDGEQRYYKVPDTNSFVLKNWVGKIGSNIDLRTDGGQVLSVGCVHPDTGKLYEWITSPADIGFADCPVDLLKQMYEAKNHTPKKSAPPLAKPSNHYAAKALNEECDRVRCAQKGNRNDTLNTAAFNLGQLVGSGMLNESEVASELFCAASQFIGDQCSEHEIKQTIQSGISAGKQKPRSAPELKTYPIARNLRSSDDKSVSYDSNSASESDEGHLAEDYILVPGPHTDDQGTYIERSNHDFAEEVLDRIPAGRLYRRDDMIGEIVGRPGKKKFKRIGVDAIRLIVDKHTRLGAWVISKKNGPQFAYKNCSNDMGRLVIDAARVHRNVRELKIIAPYPMYLPKFTLSQPGWNEGGVYYDESPDLQGLQPETDSEVIRETLEDLVIDFPFADSADRANFFGLQLTPIIRPALNGNVPMHLIMAPLERTGKSKLAEEIFGGILTGHPTPALQLGGGEEERDKRVTSLLLTGDTIAHLDNLREFIDSAVLASLLTASVYQGRVLGASNIPLLPNYLTLVASGNNVKGTGEIIKRTIPIHLQPRTDSPETRNDFRHPNLREFVSGTRRRCLSTLLGMVENWKTSDRPRGSVRLGGFEQWASVVGGIMEVNGFPSWMTTMRQWIEEADPHGADLRTLADEWFSVYGEKYQPASCVMDLARRLSVFPECFRFDSEAGRLTSFSRKVLNAHTNAPVGRWILRKSGSGNNSSYRLEVNRAAESI